MTSRCRFFHPFDATYTEVSRRVRQYIDDIGAEKEVRWLQQIVWQFQVESDRWDVKAELDAYRDEMDRLRLRILQLAAGAYLHICYDLPRVLADSWPGSPPFDPPTEMRGEKIYDRIGTFFPEAIDAVRIMPEVIGAFRPIFVWPASKKAMEVWVRLLRSDAWRHARTLHHSPPDKRAQIEDAILQAITEALSTVSARAPWHVLRMLPPSLEIDETSKMYLAAMPISTDVVSQQLSRATEITTLGVATLTLAIVILQVLVPYAKSLRQKPTNVKEADQFAAKFIEELGYDIRYRLSKIFDERPPTSDKPYPDHVL